MNPVMSLPKQIKSVRCWMSKRSGKSLTDIGYNITLDSNLRAYRDLCHVRTDSRNKPEVFGGSSESSDKDRTSDTENWTSDVMERQFPQRIEELKKFKEINNILELRRTNGLRNPSKISWTHHGHITDTNQTLDMCLEAGLSPNLNAMSANSQVYGDYFYGCKHWNFFCVDEDIGTVILSLKVELLHSKEYIRIVVRSSLQSLHVLIPPCLLGVYEHYSDPFSWIETLTQLLKLTKPLQVINHYTAGLELVKFEKVFVKSDFKIGVLYVRNGQETEDEIFSNSSHSTVFESFLHLLGSRVSLQNFEGYSGGLDTSTNSLNGTQSIYTEYRNNRIMFHVPTFMPNTGEDNKYLGKKRHVGNDVLCVVFTDEPETTFSPLWIKSQFIYAYILVHVLPTTKNHRLKFKVSMICRQEVPWFGPELPEDGTFDEGAVFREWILEKIINGDRACYKAPKFASVQQRTRSQIMQCMLDKEGDSDERVGYSSSLTPSASSSLESLEGLFPDDSLNDFDGNTPQLRYFYSSQSEGINFGDVAFLAGKTYKKRIYGMRSVMCRRSRVFRDMLTDLAIPGKLITTDNNNTQFKDDSLVKLALKKARAQAMMQNKSRKGKFAIETSLQTLPSFDEYVRTTSIKKEGQTYGISLDCVGRTREFVMDEFEADIFSCVIDYIHHDKCSITFETLPGLLCAATYYELPDLRLSCLNRRDDVITVKTVCRMLNIVEEYIFFKDGRELQEKLLQFFVENIKEISSCNEYFTILTRNRMSLVLSQNWKCEEKLKVKVLVLWAKFKDTDGWKNLAETMISSSGQTMTGVILDENEIASQLLKDDQADTMRKFDDTG